MMNPKKDFKIEKKLYKIEVKKIRSNNFQFQRILIGKWTKILTTFLKETK
jgi:hypothetical protein